MKKALALATALLLLAVTLSACGQAAIEISPYNNLPETYEMVYVIHNEAGSTIRCTAGRDADGTLYYAWTDNNGSGDECVYPIKEKTQTSSNSYFIDYAIYEMNDETGKFELQEDMPGVGVNRSFFDSCYKAAHNEIKGGSYEKVDASAIVVEDSLDYDLKDAERFEYYEITTSGGENLVAVVEKNTGICFYALYDSGYSFVLAKYNQSFDGKYADLLPEDYAQ